MPPDVALSVIIPVFNERRIVSQLRTRGRAMPIAQPIIIVDDGPTGGTAAALRELAAEPPDAFQRGEAIFHERNAGNGAAIRTAIPAAQ